ncbi:MAG: hypothetical protein LCH32_00600 [Bacteroidetes bacterium]|nr:hypothetical protein [Bacteroidota bacterium]
MNLIKFFATIVFVSVFFNSCKKDKKTEEETPSQPTTGKLKLAFNNMYGSSALILNTTDYINNSDTFKVSMFNYYISNIKLTATDNSVYNETESYHLVKANVANSLSFDLNEVPIKDYKSISFVIGVDSLRNVSGSQTGALDPANGHFWTWSSGYIMAKLEGTSPQSSDPAKKVIFHIGGFKGIYNALKTVTLNFPTSAVVTETKIPQVNFKTDLKEWFSPNAINFSTIYSVQTLGATSKSIADNYANMFSVTSVVN